MLISQNIKGLMGKLSRQAVRMVDAAAGFTMTRTHYQVSLEHFILKCIEDGSGDVVAILRYFEVDPGRVQQEMLDTLEAFPTGNQARPSFSPQFMENLEHAWVVASIDLGYDELRTGHVLVSTLKDPAFLSARNYGEALARIELPELIKRYDAITKDSTEARPARAAAAAAGKGAPAGDDSFLAQYTIDFTGQAKAGKIDPVFCRDREIREMVDILARRRKNNPIVVGEAGVGKTAVVEGLALRVVEGDIPEVLSGVSIRGLDMGLLQAGAGVKGEFEKRLKGVIEEVKASPTPIIMFIDEAHTIIGAGGPSGGSDAANLLKPPLARGELRTIAATTWSEYKKYFEKDVALARRFQVVKIDEPSPDQALDMLRGLKDKYETAHGVTILDEALMTAAQLGSRYISGRQLPDKAVDLVDTAAARVKTGLSACPAVLDDLQRSLESAERAIASLESQPSLNAEQTDSLADNQQRKKDLQVQIAPLKEKWENEVPLVEQVVEAQKNQDAPAEEAARQKLQEVQGSDGLVKVEVDSATVASVITDWTGIPLSKVLADEAELMLTLDKRICQRIKGQEWAIETLVKGVKAAKTGIKPPNTPMGVFLLVGPSGVGKTETALSVADLMFGGERYLISINMSEFQERHTTSRLIGSPPGYVGYGEGGQLTEAVRQRPYSIVLLDEVEKAHPDVLNLFYQVFDKGILNDGEGRAVDFKNTLILMTSNLATDTITQLSESPVRPSNEEVLNAVRPELSKYFKPALLARMTILPYLTLDEDAIAEIVVLKLNKLAGLLMQGQRIKLQYSQDVVKTITERCTEVEEGARNIDHILGQSLLPAISQKLLELMAEKNRPGLLNLGIDDQGFSYQFE